MKRISLIILATLALVLLVSAYGQTRQSVEVTAQTLASQPAGKPYLIDLTHTGKVYNVAAGIDYSRIRVRTSTGETAMSDLVKKLRLTGKFLLGDPSDLELVDFGFPGGGPLQDPGGVISQAKYDKSNGLWTCTGKKDCKDLASSGLCMKGGMGCYKSSCSCVSKKT